MTPAKARACLAHIQTVLTPHEREEAIARIERLVEEERAIVAHEVRETIGAALAEAEAAVGHIEKLLGAECAIEENEIREALRRQAVGRLATPLSEDEAVP